ncbi:RNA-guided endonuclease InsQ/TnpB family protein [Noviherbaspirillum soli]|uniref:RNA-guided endonuclease InsQ/TnpB family protein n=1 Tax=Noviherbaspirillum soli TaxID=1064518 RepID=UPI001E28655B|nr:transposase [Noviherbaspirillum soli]
MASQNKPDTAEAKGERNSVLTLRQRIKDKHVKYLRALAFETNQVWNYCNELSYKVFQREHRFMSGYDLQKYTNGASKEGLQLHSQTIQAIAAEYATRRKQHKKVKLAWRKSNGARRSLGWIPFKASGITYASGQIRYGKVWLSLWDSHGLKDYDLGPGNISEDARGRWYINVCATPKQKLMKQLPLFHDSVGIDLGLRDFAATSDGAVIEARKHYRELEEQLAVAQRANKKHRVKAIHAKIANRRKDFHHKLSTKFANSYGAIFIGNVNATALAKTNQAKSVLDAGWSAFRTMLQYKCDNASVWFDVVNEAYSTQTCSCCKKRTGPEGLEDLGIREWTCSECGTTHARDVNAATNILAAGHGRLAGGMPVLTVQAAARQG